MVDGRGWEVTWLDPMTHAERLREMAPRIRRDGQVFGVAKKIAEAEAALAGADALDEVLALRARVGELERDVAELAKELAKDFSSEGNT